MPQIDFKKHADPTRWQKIWHENYGNWLLSIGLVVSVVAWSVGYFDLIPEVTANPRGNVSSILATGSTLLVRVTGSPSDQGKVVVMLYHAENFNSDSVALRVEALEISNREALWRVHNIRFGRYIVIAFHDVDANEQFARGVERQGISVRAVDPDPESAERRHTLSDGVFSFSKDRLIVEVELKDSAIQR